MPHTMRCPASAFQAYVQVPNLRHLSGTGLCTTDCYMALKQIQETYCRGKGLHALPAVWNVLSGAALFQISRAGWTKSYLQVTRVSAHKCHADRYPMDQHAELLGIV